MQILCRQMVRYIHAYRRKYGIRNPILFRGFCGVMIRGSFLLSYNKNKGWV